MTAHCGRVLIFVAALVAGAGAGRSVLAQAVPAASPATEGIMPDLGQQPMPTYPTNVTAGGTVDLEIVVDVNGAIAHARVAASSDSSGVLDRTALVAVNGWRLTPAMSGGRPQAALAVARFVFTPPPQGDEAAGRKPRSRGTGGGPVLVLRSGTGQR